MSIVENNDTEVLLESDTSEDEEDQFMDEELENDLTEVLLEMPDKHLLSVLTRNDVPADDNAEQFCDSGLSDRPVFYANSSEVCSSLNPSDVNSSLLDTRSRNLSSNVDGCANEVKNRVDIASSENSHLLENELSLTDNKVNKVKNGLEDDNSCSTDYNSGLTSSNSDLTDENVVIVQPSRPEAARRLTSLSSCLTTSLGGVSSFNVLGSASSDMTELRGQLCGLVKRSNIMVLLKHKIFMEKQPQITDAQLDQYLVDAYPRYYDLEQVRWII